MTRDDVVFVCVSLAALGLLTAALVASGFPR